MKYTVFADGSIELPDFPLFFSCNVEQELETLGLSPYQIKKVLNTPAGLVGNIRPNKLTKEWLDLYKGKY